MSDRPIPERWRGEFDMCEEGFPISASTAIHVFSELGAAEAALSEANQQLKEAIDAARVMSGRIDQYCADEEQLQATICTLAEALNYYHPLCGREPLVVANEVLAKRKPRFDFRDQYGGKL